MNTILRIPFEHLGRKGMVLVECLQNPGSEQSGFDSLKATCNFDIDLCKLYPTANAKIESYDGDGYRKLMGWIQFVTRHDTLNSVTRTSTIVDVVGELGARNPYFTIGYPPEMYDAPMWNLGR